MRGVSRLMAYDDLKADIARTLQRTDLTADIVRFIRLCEGVLSRKLYGAEREEAAILTVASGAVNLPDDFRALLNITVSGSKLLTPLGRRGLDGVTTATGTPQYYLLKDEKIHLYPTPADSETVDIIYKTTIPALSDSNTTNWVLDRYEDLYLYGSLLHSAPLLQDQERIGEWSGLYEKALSEANIELMNETMTASLQVQPSVCVV